MSNYCIWCYEEMVPSFTWQDIVKMGRPKPLCERCEQQIELFDGRRCLQCSRQSVKQVCSDCVWWQTYFSDDDPLQFNQSVFKYNPFMKEVITKWKYRGDYVLAEMFKEQFLTDYLNIFSFLDDAVAVPIPLSEDRLKGRGFNQAEQLANFLPLPTENILSRYDSEKQAKKSRQERIQVKNPFLATYTINKSVVLVDDIYTTGATIRQAATLLQQQGCPQTYAYTLIRG